MMDPGKLNMRHFARRPVRKSGKREAGGLTPPFREAAERAKRVGGRLTSFHYLYRNTICQTKFRSEQQPRIHVAQTLLPVRFVDCRSARYQSSSGNAHPATGTNPAQARVPVLLKTYRLRRKNAIVIPALTAVTIARMYRGSTFRAVRAPM